MECRYAQGAPWLSRERRETVAKGPPPVPRTAMSQDAEETTRTPGHDQEPHHG